MTPPPAKPPVATSQSGALRIVVLASGSGTLLQAIIDAERSGGHGFMIAAVVTDRDCVAVERAHKADIPAQVLRLGDYADRAAWDEAFTAAVAEYRPQLVVSAGFMKILGATFVSRFAGATVNTHPALLPAFPGAHGVRDALAYGVKITGCTVHIVDEGVDTGPILAQRAIEIRPGETEAELHERIKVLEREMIVATVDGIAAGTIELNTARDAAG